MRDPATVYVSEVIDHPNIEIGDLTYCNDHRPPEDYAATLAFNHLVGAPEQVTIGEFRQIAEDVQFVTSSPNHPMAGASTCRFATFDPPRAAGHLRQAPSPEHTHVGADCWVGRQAIIVVDPARVIRMPRETEEIAWLKRLARWTWPVERTNRAVELIEGGDVAAL